MEIRIVDENTVFINEDCYKSVPVDEVGKCECCAFFGDLNMCLASPPCTARWRSGKENVIFVKEGSK